MLHSIDGGIRYGDTLSPEGQALPKATLILTNLIKFPMKSNGATGVDF